MSKPKLAVIVDGNLAAAGPGDKNNIDGLGTAATRDVATNAEAKAGAAGVLPDAAGVQASFGQYGLGSKGTSLGNDFDFNSGAAFIDGSWQLGVGMVNGPTWPASYSQLRVTRGSGSTVNQTVYSHVDNRTAFRTGVTTAGHMYDIRNKSWIDFQTTGNILTTTGQSTRYPMTQKAVTDAINARGFADASGVLTVTSGALSNDMSSFLSQTTKATMRSNLEVPQLNASATQQGGLKARLTGTTLYLTNNGTNP